MATEGKALKPAERLRSREVFRKAQEVLVGGVNSPVRAFQAVGGEPVIVARAAGSRLWDADGNAYLDYVCSWGALDSWARGCGRRTRDRGSGVARNELRDDDGA